MNWTLAHLNVPKAQVCCLLGSITWFGLTPGLHCQIFQNQAPSWGITQYDWDGIYGAAVSSADWNDDGWADLTFGGTQGAVRTFVNQGGAGFEVVPLPYSMTGETKALIWIDFDNDGDDDLFIQDDTGKCGLIRNDGNNAFTNVTEWSGLPQAETEAAGVSFGDMDNDGDLDLHLCRYLQFAPDDSLIYRNALFENMGDLVFADVSASSGIADTIYLSFQSIWFDQDGDGWQDIFVINDKSDPNALYRNNGDGTFTEVAAELEMDIIMDCMTATLGDFNQDAIQDLFLTNTPFGGDGLGAKLLVGQPDGGYMEASAVHGLDMDRYCWGAAWLDVDNDRDLDLFVAEHEFLSPYGINYLYENLGAESGYSFEPFGTDVYDLDYLNSHVVTTADFDHNGWQDFVVHNVGNHAARVWMNSGFDNGFQSLGISLRGTISNRPGVGSEVRLQAGGIIQSRIFHAGENYLNQGNETMHFGLGDAGVEFVEVRWPSGLWEVFDAEPFGLQPGHQHLLVEGHSPCPHPVVWHHHCTAPSEVHIGNIPAPFDFVLSDEFGNPIDGTPPFVEWNAAMGNITVSFLWDDVPTCSVVHHVSVGLMDADLDGNNSVGAEDLMLLLADIGCSQSCTGDFDGDGLVNVPDLLLFLSYIGLAC